MILTMNTNQSNTLSKLHYQRVCHVAETLGPGTLLVALRTGQPRLPTLAESKSETHQLDLAESDTARSSCSSPPGWPTSPIGWRIAPTNFSGWTNTLPR